MEPLDSSFDFFLSEFSDLESSEEVSKLQHERTIIPYYDPRIVLDWVVSYLEKHNKALAYLVHPIKFIITCVYDLGIDGDHPWKQAKYECTINQLKRGLQPSVRALISLEKRGLTPLQVHLKSIAEIIFDVKGKWKQNYRLQHQIFIQKLRKALDSEEYIEGNKKKICSFFKGTRFISYPKEIDDLNEIAAMIYTSNFMYTFSDCVISGAIAQSLQVIDKESSVTELIDIDSCTIAEQRDAIAKLPQAHKAPLMVIWFNNFIGVLGKGFDPHSIGNIPYVLFDLVANNTTRFFRTGSPTIGAPDPEIPHSSTRISPEFRSFVRHVKEEKKSMIFWSLQKAKEGSEGARSRAIRELFVREKMQHSYVRLSHDCPFYYQSGEYKDQTNAEKFKDTLRYELSCSSNFYIPETWLKDRDFMNGVNNVIKYIHEDIFFNKEHLDREERQIFIDIFYSFFILISTIYFEPDYTNVTCKDALDRAGKTIYLLVYLVLLCKNELNKETNHMLMVLTFAAPFLVKKQALVIERFERLMQCYELLSDEIIIENLQSLSPLKKICSMVNINVHPEKSQQFDMSKGKFKPDL